MSERQAAGAASAGAGGAVADAGARGALARLAAGALKGAGVVWFLAAAVGQIAFVYYILVYYGGRTLSGNYAAWNDRPIIDGYIAGDGVGNFMFAAHVLLAAAITLGGLAQLTPQIRDRARRFHRWNGRVFLLIAYFMAGGGIWLGWVRGTRLSDISAAAVSLNGVLIILFASLAWFYAATRRIDTHRQWAMRTFIAVNGVWFFRVGIMAWIILNQGPAGMNETLSGPADIALSFGSYLAPLAVLEVYFAAGRARTAGPKLAAALLVLIMTALMAVGIFGTITLMWGDYI